MSYAFFLLRFSRVERAPVPLVRHAAKAAHVGTRESLVLRNVYLLVLLCFYPKALWLPISNAACPLAPPSLCIRRVATLTRCLDLPACSLAAPPLPFSSTSRREQVKAIAEGDGQTALEDTTLRRICSSIQGRRPWTATTTSRQAGATARRACRREISPCRRTRKRSI